MAGYVSPSSSIPMLQYCRRRGALVGSQSADGKMLVRLLPAACALLSAHFPLSTSFVAWKLGPRPEVCLPYHTHTHTHQILNLEGG